MNRRPGGTRVATVVGVLLLGLSLLAAAALALPGALDARRKAPLSVTQQGSVSGLYPGRSTTVAVVVRNTSRKPVRLRSVSARPQAAGPCPAAMLRVGEVRSKKVLKPRRGVTVRIPVLLLRSAPDACQGRTFRLVLRAKSTPVR